MNEINNWYKDFEKRISSFKQKMNKSDYCKYKVAQLQSLAHKINNISDCSTCHNLKKEITFLVNELEDMPSMTENRYKKYIVNIDTLSKHLKESHRMVSVNQYTSLLTAVPILIGIVLAIVGIVAQSWLLVGIGLFGGVIGTVIGFTVGRILDIRAEKQGRTI